MECRRFMFEITFLFLGKGFSTKAFVWRYLRNFFKFFMKYFLSIVFLDSG